MILPRSLKSTFWKRFSHHSYNTVRTYHRVAYIPTWQTKNGNYFKNVLLDRRLNLIAKRKRTQKTCLLRMSSQSTFLSCQSIFVSARCDYFDFSNKNYELSILSNNFIVSIYLHFLGGVFSFF